MGSNTYSQGIWKTRGILVRIYNQQYQGTVILMSFDLQVKPI